MWKSQQLANTTNMQWQQNTPSWSARQCPYPPMMITSWQHSYTCQPENLSGFLQYKGNTHWTNHIPDNKSLIVNHSLRPDEQCVFVCMECTLTGRSQHYSIQSISCGTCHIYLKNSITADRKISLSLHHSCLISHMFCLHHAQPLQVHMLSCPANLTAYLGHKRKTCAGLERAQTGSHAF